MRTTSPLPLASAVAPSEEMGEKLLLLYQNNILDTSPLNKVFTGIVPFSTVIKKIGDYSAAFPGALQTLDSDDWAMKKGKFTVDYWQYLNPAGNQCIAQFATNYTKSSGFLCSINSAVPSIALYQSNDWKIQSTALDYYQWYHVAFVGNGGADGSRNIKLYVNGIQQGSTYVFDYNLTDRHLLLGAITLSDGGGMTDYNVSNINAFRVTKGQELWTSNFTPPLFYPGQEIKVTPNMTDYSVPSGVVTSSSEYSGEYSAVNAFNDGSQSFIGVPEPSSSAGWLKYAFDVGNSAIVNRYKIKNRQSGSVNSIKSWSLQASNNDTDWTILHSVLNDTRDDGDLIRTFNIRNNIAYRFYKIVVTDRNGGDNYFAINELILLQVIS